MAGSALATCSRFVRGGPSAPLPPRPNRNQPATPSRPSATIPTAPIPTASNSSGRFFFRSGTEGEEAAGSRGGGSGLTCGIFCFGACAKAVNSTGSVETEAGFLAGPLTASGLLREESFSAGVADALADAGAAMEALAADADRAVAGTAVAAWGAGGTAAGEPRSTAGRTVAAAGFAFPVSS